jgi:hypothetical protein
VSTPSLNFPALYTSANEGSIKAQRSFLWTMRCEYILLFAVSVASATRGWSGATPIAITLLLVILAGLFVYRVSKRLDQKWYRCRALAESVKTSTWRFAMRAHPFENNSSIGIPTGNFRNLLREILHANREIAANLKMIDVEEVTQSMLTIRQLSLENRMNYYVKHRIDNQRIWYATKSKANERALSIWVALTILMYVLAALILNAGMFGYPNVSWVFDPMIVLVTSAIGWMQIKRHGELMASYNLTAHEIGIIKNASVAVSTEQELSDFINEAELAFSREHTQWVARRDAN